MIKRYDMEYGVNKFFSREPQVQPVQSAQGAWVSFEDYAVLAAQVEALRDIGLRLWNSPESTSRQDVEAEVDLWLELKGVLAATPQQHLAEIKAQAGREGFVAGSEQTAQFITGEIGYVLPLLKTRANQYADKIRQGE